MRTTVEVTEDRVIIRRNSGQSSVSVLALTFAEVRGAAAALAHYLTENMPAEIPVARAPRGYPRCGSAYEGGVCTRSPGHYGAHGPAATGPHGAPPKASALELTSVESPTPEEPANVGHEMDPVRMLCKWCQCGGGPPPSGPCPGRLTPQRGPRA